MPSSNDQAITSNPTSTDTDSVALPPLGTPERQRKKTSATFHLLAGLGSGFTSAILLQPADLLKTRVQQSRSNSVLSTVREIFSEPQPLRQLWRGTLPSVIRTSVGSALYFTTLNSLRSRAAQSRLFTVESDGSRTARDGNRIRTSSATSSSLPKLTPLANLASGAFARASVGFVLMPITVIKVRYESNFYNYSSLLQASRDIAAREGIKGFFSGFGATAIRDAPYAGLYVVFYEQGKKMLSRMFARTYESDGIKTPNIGEPALAETSTIIRTKSQLTPTLSASINFLSGAIAAASATLITNPPDAIKTRLQLQPKKYRNSMQALKLMLKEEGVRSLFDGLALRMARKAMSSALAWTVYEEVVRRAEAKFVDEA